MRTTHPMTALPDRTMAFINELCMTSGAIYGGLIGLDQAVQKLGETIKPVSLHLPPIVDASYTIIPVLQSAFLGSVAGGSIAYGVPFLASCIKNITEQVPFTDQAMSKSYNDFNAQMMGLASGTALGITMAWGLAINPFHEKEQTIVTPLSEHTISIAEAQTRNDGFPSLNSEVTAFFSDTKSVPATNNMPAIGFTPLFAQLTL
jgi:hypothetical protein